MAAPTTDLDNWRLVFSDDFPTDGWTDSSGHGTYDPARVVSIAGPEQDITVSN